MQIFPSFYWPKVHHVTCKKLPTNNGLLMRNVVQLCLASFWLQIMLWSCVNETTLSSFLRSLVREKIS